MPRQYASSSSGNSLIGGYACNMPQAHQGTRVNCRNADDLVSVSVSALCGLRAAAYVGITRLAI